MNYHVTTRIYPSDDPWVMSGEYWSVVTSGFSTIV